MSSVFVITGLVFLIGLVWLMVWAFGKITRGEIGFSVNTALLALLVVILLVPFAMNLSAHFVYKKIHHSEGATKEAATESIE